MSRPRNASGRHAWVTMTDADIVALTKAIIPDVDKVLEGIAGQIADEARASNAFQDGGKSIDVVRGKDFEFDKKKRHKHLRQSIEPRKSRYEEGGWIVRAGVPHAINVEFGHLKVLWGHVTAEHVPAHSFLRKAKADVESRLAPKLGWGGIS